MNSDADREVVKRLVPENKRKLNKIVKRRSIHFASSSGVNATSAVSKDNEGVNSSASSQRPASMSKNFAVSRQESLSQNASTSEIGISASTAQPRVTRATRIKVSTVTRIANDLRGTDESFPDHSGLKFSFVFRAHQLPVNARRTRASNRIPTPNAH